MGMVVIAGMVTGFLWYAPESLSRLFFAPTESTVPQGVTPTAEVLEDEEMEDVMLVAQELSVPWEVLFLPDGSMLVTERTGTLVHFSGDMRTQIAVPDVSARGEGGLLGAALHPDFENNRWLYLYATHQASGGTKNRVVRYVFDDGALREETSIIENIPGASYHDGGRIAFGPDGMLYVTTGDAGIEASAQDRNSLAGKILRVHADGSVPEDNPFGTVVYSYGHRNPQGLAWDEDGTLWSTEHGRSGVQSGYDELNRIVAGGNYGWPIIEGDETQEGMIAPVIHSGADDTWAPASLAYADGVLYWGGLRGNSLYEARRDGEAVRELVAHFRGTYGRLRAATIGPDGRLYITTSNTDGRGSAKAGDDKIISIDRKYLSK